MLSCYYRLRETHRYRLRELTRAREGTTEHEIARWSEFTVEARRCVAAEREKERETEKALHHTGAGGCDGVAGEREGSGGGPRDGG